LIIAFVAWESYLGPRALLPVEMLFNRTQLFAGLAIFLIMSTHLNAIYHLPFFYQAKGRSAAQSGVDIFPYVLGMVLGSIGTAIIVRRSGRYWHFLITGPIFATIGAGLLYTVKADTNNAKLIGYQILAGFGIGNCFQLPRKSHFSDFDYRPLLRGNFRLTYLFMVLVMAIQAEYAHRPDFISQASSLQLFFQLLGGVVGIS
jgi:MFS family permease